MIRNSPIFSLVSLGMDSFRKGPDFSNLAGPGQAPACRSKWEEGKKESSISTGGQLRHPTVVQIRARSSQSSAASTEYVVRSRYPVSFIMDIMDIIEWKAQLRMHLPGLCCWSDELSRAGRQVPKSSSLASTSRPRLRAGDSNWKETVPLDGREVPSGMKRLAAFAGRNERPR